MLTIIESPFFTKLWPDYWSEEEHGEFAAYLAREGLNKSSFVIPANAGALYSSGADHPF